MFLSIKPFTLPALSYLMFNLPLIKTSQQRKTARHCRTPMKSSIIILILRSTRRGFTIRLKRLKPRVPDFGGPQHFGSKDNFQHFCKHYIRIFVLVERTFFFLQPLRLRCAEMRGSPRTECARRTTPNICGTNKQ